MRTELQTLDDGLGRNDAVTISSKSGWLDRTLAAGGTAEPKNVAALKSEVGERWPMTSLLDMLPVSPAHHECWVYPCSAGSNSAGACTTK